MDLTQRIDLALELRSQGKNCAQCVLLAFNDLTGGDPDTLEAAAAGFGSGMATGDICGAVSGGVMALGLIFSHEPRPDLYARVRQFIQAFEAVEGSRMCSTLKSMCNAKSCPQLISDAVSLMHVAVQE